MGGTTHKQEKIDHGVFALPEKPVWSLAFSSPTRGKWRPVQYCTVKNTTAGYDLYVCMAYILFLNQIRMKYFKHIQYVWYDSMLNMYKEPKFHIYILLEQYSKDKHLII